MKMKMGEEEQGIVIVGGGICGLATALALHRKGIRSIVLERSETLRAAGVGIIMQPNGWRALQQLGIAPKLRETAVRLSSVELISVFDGKSFQLVKHDEKGDDELRCLKRMDLIKALSEPLPEGTVRLGCQVVSVSLDPVTAYPLVQLVDGSIIRAMTVIGCDGLNSKIGSFVGMSDSPRAFCRCATRGFAYYDEGHAFGNKFRIFNTPDVQLGTLPVTDKLVYWFLTRLFTSRDSEVGSSKRDQTFIKEATLEAAKGFPEHVVELIEKSDVKSLYLTELRYRTPWELLRAKFQKGCVTVAGDAMHAMCPFISQGGGASLEDAVVLARCVSDIDPALGSPSENKIQQALGRYVKERRMRLFWLSLQTYLTGLTLDNTCKMNRVVGIALLIIIFGDPKGHTQFDCGRL